MGMDAAVTCVGKFKSNLKSCLSYEESYYDKVEEGKYVVTELLQCQTSDISERLAEVLGVEPWDFNTHEVKEDKVDWKGLEELFCEEEEVEKLRTLLQNDFICLYCPNG